jgi:hypothetical protein
MSTLVPDGSSWHLVLKEAAEKWKQVSGGRVSVRLFPGGVAGDDPDVVRKMRLGTLNAGVLTSVGVAEIDKATRYGFGFRFASIGVVEFIDFGGNDILYYASRYLAQEIDAARFASPAIVDQFMEQGRIGLKAGRGFHDYSGIDVGAYRRDVLGRSLGMLRHLDLLQEPGAALRHAQGTN